MVVSVDEIGMIEYWSGTKKEFQTPTCVNFESKLDTDLFEFVKNKTFPRCMTISPNGLQFATIGEDKKVSVLVCVCDHLLSSHLHCHLYL